MKRLFSKKCVICEQDFIPNSGRQRICLGEKCHDIYKDFLNKGLNPKEIAEKLSLSPSMVAIHLEKLGLYTKKKYRPREKHKPRKRKKCQGCIINSLVEMPSRCFREVIITMEEECPNIPSCLR